MGRDEYPAFGDEPARDAFQTHRMCKVRGGGNGLEVSAMAKHGHMLHAAHAGCTRMQ